jgi:hypothetical protein
MSFSGFDFQEAGIAMGELAARVTCEGLRVVSPAERVGRFVEVWLVRLPIGLVGAGDIKLVELG